MSIKDTVDKIIKLEKQVIELKIELKEMLHQQEEEEKRDPKVEMIARFNAKTHYTPWAFDNWGSEKSRDEYREHAKDLLKMLNCSHQYIKSSINEHNNVCLHCDAEIPNRLDIK